MPDRADGFNAPKPSGRLVTTIGPDGRMYDSYLDPLLGEIQLAPLPLLAPPVEDDGEPPRGKDDRPSPVEADAAEALRGASPRSPTGPPLPAPGAAALTGGRRHG